MRVVVIREFIDKNTGDFHAVGEKLTVDEERFAEIQKKGKFLVDISDEVEQPEENPAVPDEQEFNPEESEPVQTEPIEQTEPEQTPPKVGRRSRTKKESEDK